MIVTFLNVLTIASLVVLPHSRSNYASCALANDDVRALAALLQMDWSTISEERLPALWHQPTPWGGRANGEEPCGGSLTLSNLIDVVANECRCCDTFTFVDNMKGGKCFTELSAVNLTRTVIATKDADRLALSIRTLIVTIPETHLTNAHSGFSAVSWPTPTVNQTSDLSITPTPVGIRVRLLVYRTTFPSASHQ